MSGVAKQDAKLRMLYIDLNRREKTIFKRILTKNVINNHYGCTSPELLGQDHLTYY